MLTATTFAIVSMKMASHNPPKHGGSYFLGIGVAALSLALAGTFLGAGLTKLVPAAVIVAVPVITAVFLAARLATPMLTEKHGFALLGFIATPLVKPYFGAYAFIVVAIAVAIAASLPLLKKGVSDVG